MGKKYVIFDFDGTLADTLEAGVAILNSLSDKFRFGKISAENLEKLRGDTAREMLKDIDIALWKLPFIAHMVRRNLAKQITKQKLYVGMEQMLEQLKSEGAHLAILTTGSEANVRAFLKFNKIENYFEFIYAERRLFKKGRTLKKLLNKYYINPDNAIYVGDEVRDIDAAREAGVKVVAVTWGVNSVGILQKNKPDAIVNAPVELIEAIKNI